MKILYAVRLFSGLEQSFHDRVWNPTGVPTIYRIIEEFDKRYEMQFVFTAKDSGKGYLSSWVSPHDIECIVNGLIHKVVLLAGTRYFPLWFPRKIAMILRELRHLMVLIFYFFKQQPDLIYCDHANVIAAAVFSRIQKKVPVVFRVMGVYPSMREVLKSSNNIVHSVYRWAYKSPFNLVICTQDGSGVEVWMESALRQEVKREVLLNGTDQIIYDDIILDPSLERVESIQVSESKIIILFVGKLEKYKGCYTFVDSIITLLKKSVSNIHALIIGTGSESENLLKLVHRSGYGEYFTFIERLSHKQVFAAHGLSDIYVSMNSLGNLSNANLEAIQSNDCMIIPESQSSCGVDVTTSELLGDSVLMVPIFDVYRLSNAMYDLISSHEKRYLLSSRLKKRKKSFLWSWEERINCELDLIQESVFYEKLSVEN